MFSGWLVFGILDSEAGRSVNVLEQLENYITESLKIALKLRHRLLPHKAACTCEIHCREFLGKHFGIQ
jgi:hypothetical protein